MGVTEGHKTALTLKNGIDKLESILSSKGAPFNRKMLCGWVASVAQPQLKVYESLGDVSATLPSLRALAARCKLTTGQAVADFITALQSEIATQASLGLLLPAVQ